jgi:multidrug resistance efflux pump
MAVATTAPCAWATAWCGKPVLALLDTASFRIDGYFEETDCAAWRRGSAWTSA